MRDNEIYEENLQHFQIVRRHGDSAQCRCPAHSDRQASLTISRGRKCTLFRCHAGCALDDILQAAGLEKKDTFYESESRETDWRRYIEKREHRKIEAVYNYVSSVTGSYVFTKIRLEGKKILYGILENNRFFYGLRGQSRKELKAVYGSLEAIRKAIKEGEPIFIPEGEKDVNTLIKKGYAAFSCGGANDWNKNVSELCNGAEVIILADNDDPGKKLAATIEKDLKGISKSVKIIVPMPDTPKADITDYFEAGHSKEEFEALIKGTTLQKKGMKLSATSPDDVLKCLDCNYDKDGNIKGVKQLVKNCEIVMEKDSRVSGKIRFNEFSRQAFLFGNVPWEKDNNYRAWGSSDDSSLFSIIQADYGLKSRNDYFDAFKNVAFRNKFNPVKQMLDSLKWDGKPHIQRLLPDFLGAEDSEYNRQVMRLWMIGAVARIYMPGCKFDYTMILQGKQGIGKSTFLRLMALDDAWFNDSLDSLDSDKAVQSLTGSWIIELAELKSLARTAGGVESVKRFLSATQDKYRVPYERRADTFYRQCVFAGTTNRADFLQDETGNRRFLIVQIGINEPSKSLFDSTAMGEIKQAWAEAVYIWNNEKPILVLPESCKKEAEELQQENMADDGLAGIIEEYLKDKDRICARQIWHDALKESAEPPKWKVSNINSIIEKIPGWKRLRSPARFAEYGMQRGFEKMSTNKSDFVRVSDEELKEMPFE